MEELLEQIGLTKSEISVYLALLELGSSSTGKIVEKAGVASSKVYELLEKLIQKGLVSFVIKSKVKYFEAASPSRIMDYMREKEEKIAKQKEELEKIIPQLEIKRSMTESSETQVFKAMKGAQTAFNDILYTLGEGDEVIVSGFADASEEFQKFLMRFHRKRSAKGIKLRAINGLKMKKLSDGFSNLPYSEGRVMPIDQPIAILVYSDKTLFSMPHDELWIQIKNKRLSDSMKANFEKQWNEETFVVRGFDAIQEIFNEMIESGHCDFIGARGYLMDHRPEFIKRWSEAGVKKGFTMRNIVDPEVEGHFITKLPFVKTKYTLKKEFANMSVFWIYGGKVVIANWTTSDPTAIVINNKDTYQMYKKQFELLWKE